MIPKPEPRRKKRPNPGHPYLRWLKDRPCCVCGATPSEAAHVRGPMSLKTKIQLDRRIAEAYQGTATRYGQIGAAWYPMPGGRHAYLGGTDPADLVLLTPLAGPATEGWVTEADS